MSVRRQRRQPILIDNLGVTWPAHAPEIIERVRSMQPRSKVFDYTLSHLGYVHILPLDRNEILVSLRPQRVSVLTMAATFYAIRDLAPRRVYISTAMRSREWEAFDDVSRAIDRIDALVTGAPNAKLPMDHYAPGSKTPPLI